MAYDDYEALRVEVAGGIATVTIDHPPINLFDLVLYLELRRLAETLAADDAVRVVVLRSGVEGFFIAHFDVSLILQLPQNQPEPAELNDFHRMCETFRTMPKPTVAVVEGRVGGGGSELVLSCDLRFAAREQAVFSQPEVALGIIPGGTGTVRLARLLGRSRALEVILGCGDVDAATADAWGWVNRSLPAAELWPFVDALTARLAAFPAPAVAAAKAAVLRAEGDLTPDLLAEAAAFNRLLGHEESRAGMQRFLDIGGQTEEGERRLQDLVTELARGSNGPPPP